MFSAQKLDIKATELKAGLLLSEPLHDEGPKEEENIERAVCSYSNESERFLLKDRSFSRQYAQIYSVRIMAMSKKLATAARRKWGFTFKIKKLSEVKTDEKCFVIGTLFKKMEMKPSILKEISEEHNLMPQPSRERFTEDSDELVIEDETERVSLTGNIQVGTCVTGSLVALCGRTIDSGKFAVEDYCFSGLPYQTVPNLDKHLSKGEDCYVAFISGLGFGDKSQDLLGLQMFSDLVIGELGSVQDQESCSKISRVIIAGNALSHYTVNKDSEAKAKYLTRNTEAGSVEAMKCLDEFLMQLASCVPVDIMPGEFDPANHTVPQQPLHRCMFPQAADYPTFQSVTNPYEAVIGGVRILGTSGQNIQDISKVSTFEDGLDILEHNMIWGHIAPTAPDTLGCYPYYEKDPFILEKCPHVYFVGNQHKYASKVIQDENGQKVLLVTVPAFSSTKTCVMLNLRTLTCHPINFSSFPLTPDVEALSEAKLEI
ncbi:DNA polymerase delta subunit 2-like [Stylophora pistillata]|uniref:DNA polymerase delta subunit 2-like n=1 Tax=Stylophora pistillata TaxID=50429 RepID=UPI000C048AE1|nr:DNA polymerase delta subunit 2-like [Stylophora pistillata]